MSKVAYLHLSNQLSQVSAQLEPVSIFEVTSARQHLSASACLAYLYA